MASLKYKTKIISRILEDQEKQEEIINQTDDLLTTGKTKNGKNVTYQCKLCDKIFRQPNAKAHLKSHIEAVHEQL